MTSRSAPAADPRTQNEPATRGLPPRLAVARLTGYRPDGPAASRSNLLPYGPATPDDRTTGDGVRPAGGGRTANPASPNQGCRPSASTPTGVCVGTSTGPTKTSGSTEPAALSASPPSGMYTDREGWKRTDISVT